MSDPRWIEGRVVARRQWTDTLFSLHVEADPIKFEAGQFVKLALPDTEGAAAEGVGGVAVEGRSGPPLIGRPYSFVNAPGRRPHEFFCVTVPQGPLSPRLAALDAGDVIFVARQPSGFLVLSEVPDANSLWLMCTGTGIGPFLSILGSDAAWRRYPQIVLVQGTRHLEERTHTGLIEAMATEHPGRFRSIALVSRDTVTEGNGMLAGRIPQAIADGRLEAMAGVTLHPDSAQVMLCGNPAMVEDVTATLKDRGMRKHRRRAPGHITVENYW